MTQGCSPFRRSPSLSSTCNGREGRAACKSVCADLGGVEILHCPQRTLTIVEKSGLREAVEQPEKLDRTFRQPGHKAARRSEPEVSYTVDKDGGIHGPTGDGSGTVSRHANSASESETVFLVFRQGAKGSILFKEAQQGLRQLCTAMANTNHYADNAWESSSIHWTAGQRIELSVTNMLHMTETGQACLNAFRTATSDEVDDGAFFENRIKLGFTSSRSRLYVRGLSTSAAEARRTLARIAALEARFLAEIEAEGERGILQQLQTLGLPLAVDNRDRVVLDCTAAGCRESVGKRFTVKLASQGAVGERRISGLCIFCAMSTPNPRDAPADRAGKRARCRPAKSEEAMDAAKGADTLGAQGNTAADLARQLSRSRSSGSSSNGKGKTIRSPGYKVKDRKRRTTESETPRKRRKDEPDDEWEVEMAGTDEVTTDDEN